MTFARRHGRIAAGDDRRPQHGDRGRPQPSAPSTHRLAQPDPPRPARSPRARPHHRGTARGRARRAAPVRPVRDLRRSLRTPSGAHRGESHAHRAAPSPERRRLAPERSPVDAGCAATSAASSGTITVVNRHRSAFHHRNAPAIAIARSRSRTSAVEIHRRWRSTSGATSSRSSMVTNSRPDEHRPRLRRPHPGERRARADRVAVVARRGAARSRSRPRRA